MGKTLRGFEYEINSEFSHGFSNHGCFHCAILEAHKERDTQFLFQNVQKRTT